MRIGVQGETAYAFTAGKKINPDLPSVLFVHGASLDHTVWTLQARYFARHGLNVVAVDLPGHGRSTGEPLPTIGAYADWLKELLDELNLSSAVFIGHSMGSLVVLEAAAKYPERAEKLVLVGTATPVTVTDELLNLAKSNDHEAIDMLTAWGHSPSAHFGGCDTPGMWMIGGLTRLFERGSPGVLYNDRNASNDYRNGIKSARKIQYQTMLILGERDMLTPVCATRDSVDSLKFSEVVVIPRVGHTIMSEKPDVLLDSLYA